MTAEFYDNASEENFRDLIDAVHDGLVATVIGAGLSARSYPSWPGLHAIMGERAGTRSRPFRPETVVSDFDFFRSRMGEEGFLAVVKELYGYPVVDAPDLYRVLDDIANLHPLITTNFDENLASVAHLNGREQDISAFPQPVTQSHYIYLHGRASTAPSSAELVIGVESYARAYGEGGPANLILRGMLLNSVLFVGSSLLDPDLLAVLDQSYRSGLLRGRNEACSYAILPARPIPAYGEMPLDEQVAIETERLQAKSVEAIWYTWDEDYTQLSPIVRRLRWETVPREPGPRFLAVAEELDNLANSDSPTREQEDRAIRLIEPVPAYRAYFLSRVKSVGWFEPLFRAGLLTVVSEPRTDLRGRTRISPWAAAPYVGRIMTTYPHGAALLIRSLKDTENWQVRNVLAETSTKLPIGDLKTVLPVLLNWLEEDSSVGLVSHYLTTLANRLSVRPQAHLALRVFSKLTEPTGGRTPSVELRIEDYDLERLDDVASRLIESLPDGTYRALKRNFKRALEVDSLMSRLALWWRPSIEDRSVGDSRMNPSLHFLLDKLRDALLKCIDVGEIGSREVSRMITGDERWGRRLGLYAIQRRPHLAYLLDDVIQSPRRLSRFVRFGEFRSFLTHHFFDIATDSQAAIHRTIQRGLKPGGPNQRPLSDDWRWALLEAVPAEARTDVEHDWMAQPETQSTEYEEQRDRREVAWDDGSTIPPDLMLAAREGHVTLVAYLRRSKSAWMHIDKLVRADPTGMLDLARILTRDDFPDAFSYFSAYLSLMKDEVPFAWRPLVDLCDRVVKAGEIDRGGTIWAVSWLLRDGLGNRTNGIPDELLDQAFSLMVDILSATFTPLETGLERADLKSHQLNDPAGRAADAVVFYIWRRRAEQERTAIASEANILIERALNDGWGGMELRHALGNHVRIMEWSEENWLGGNIARLWPNGEDTMSWNARRAFWNGYLWDNQLISAIMRVLTEQYRGVITSFRGDSNPYLQEGELPEQLGIHVSVGWLRDLQDFGFDGLLGDFVSAAPDSLRAHVVWFMGKEFNQATEPEWQARMREKMIQYWRWRHEALQALSPAVRSDELTRFCDWPNKLNLPAEEVRPLLSNAIRHLTSGYAIENILNYLVAIARAEPLHAAELLEELVSLWAPDHEMYWIGDQMEQVVGAIFAAGGQRVRASLERTVGTLLMAHRGDLRALLSE